MYAWWQEPMDHVKASSCAWSSSSHYSAALARAPVAVVPCCRHVAPTVKGHMLYVTRAKAIACLSLRSICARQCKYTAHSAARMHAFLVPDRSTTTSTRWMDSPVRALDGSETRTRRRLADRRAPGHARERPGGSNPACVAHHINIYTQQRTC